MFRYNSFCHASVPILEVAALALAGCYSWAWVDCGVVIDSGSTVFSSLRRWGQNISPFPQWPVLTFSSNLQTFFNCNFYFIEFYCFPFYHMNQKDPSHWWASVSSCICVSVRYVSFGLHPDGSCHVIGKKQIVNSEI